METEEILAAIQKAAETIATPNWAAILSVIISLLAVVVAGFVAWKQIEISKRQADISNKQNKIALFEKKYEVYCELFKVISIGGQIDDSKPFSRFESLHEIEVIYGIDIAIDQGINDQLVSILTQVKLSEYIIRQSMFLFDYLTEADIDKLMECLMNCMIFIVKSRKEFINPKTDDVRKFSSACKEFKESYLVKIETELSLK